MLRLNNTHVHYTKKFGKSEKLFLHRLNNFTITENVREFILFEKISTASSGVDAGYPCGVAMP